MTSPRSFFVALAVASFAAGALHCASTDPSPTDSTPAPVVAADAWEPVAGYLGTDDATGAKVHQLLNAQGIQSAAGGSLGYTVNVPAHDAERARAILKAAIADGTLTGTNVYEVTDFQH